MPKPFPRWLEPMAATLTQERFTSAEWTFERKYDGIRGMAYRQGRDVKLYSRNQLPQHNPAVVAAILALDARDVILDGCRGASRGTPTTSSTSCGSTAGI